MRMGGNRKGCNKGSRTIKIRADKERVNLSGQKERRVDVLIP